MKKIIIVISAIVLLISCKEEPIDYMILSGKIINSTRNEITIFSYRKGSDSQKISLDAEGNFRDTVKVKEGFYSLSQGKEIRNTLNVFIKKGFDITINFDEKDLKNTLKMDGPGSNHYYYLNDKKGISDQTFPQTSREQYLLEESEFKNLNASLKLELTNLINNYDGIDSEFKELEKKCLHFEYLGRINSYTRLHGVYAKNPDYKPSDDFLKEFKEVNYNDGDGYKNSMAYLIIAGKYYGEKVKELATNDSISFDIAQLKVYGKIENEFMKNSFLFGTAQGSITYSDNFENYYKEYMASSTNKENNEVITETYNKLKKVAKGKPSPKFIDYENYAGGTTSLDDLFGDKYIYIDMWATWCGPCLAQIPHLQKIEEKYHDKNIKFVSISIDRVKDHDKWKKMIADKELGGMQLLADSDWNSEFVKNYAIKGIPRFILLDPQGKIVRANAPAPSQPELITLFNELGI